MVFGWISSTTPSASFHSFISSSWTCNWTFQLLSYFRFWLANLPLSFSISVYRYKYLSPFQLPFDQFGFYQFIVYYVTVPVKTKPKTKPILVSHSVNRQPPLFDGQIPPPPPPIGCSVHVCVCACVMTFCVERRDKLTKKNWKVPEK